MLNRTKYVIANLLLNNIKMSMVSNSICNFISNATEFRYSKDLLSKLENSTMDQIKCFRKHNEFFLNNRIDFVAKSLFDQYGEQFDRELKLTIGNFMRTQVKRWRMKIEQKLIDTSTVCKICGAKVPVSYLLTHSKFCLKSYDIR